MSTIAIALSIALLTIVWVMAWGAARALVVDAPLGHSDAILVMAGAPVYFSRVAHAGRLFLDGRAERILLTNDDVRGSWSNTLQRNPLYYERAILRLTQSGVPATAIELLPGYIASTYDEAMLARQYARTHALKSLTVVTSDFHSRRAVWAVRRALRDMGVAVGVDPATPLFAVVSPRTWWLFPRGWQVVLGEYLKLAYYCARYR